MNTRTNTSEGNSDYITLTGSGRSHIFDTLANCGDHCVQVDPPPISRHLSWYPTEAQPPPATYNTSLGSQDYPTHDGSLQLGYRDNASLPGTLAAYPGHQRLSASHSESSIATPQLPVVEVLDPGEAQETYPPVLGIDVSVSEVESILRETYNIPSTVPVHINSIPDPPPPGFTYVALTQIAIWSSREARLTLADIYSCLEKKFAHLRNPDTAAKWKGNVRHLLSLKKCFVKSEKQAGRHYWSLDYRYLKGLDKRERKRGRKTRNASTKAEEIDEISHKDPVTKDDLSSSSSPFSTNSLNRHPSSTFIARPSDARVINTR
ncbi:hypothetical protein E1B28_002345 [Marasmius oreades]|uniref:Fork-head domain-containing protein n=1 Tax=Marasmius oreades TaxID=181124 RepID=A0A9P7UL92_9AGAR|nr:uncharacterized protein E1B28_002345 [Marasmius oreades]KAG7086388.1 hypothetical protein E1B28_002345 [Marasmius oreades]